MIVFLRAIVAFLATGLFGGLAFAFLTLVVVKRFLLALKVVFRGFFFTVGALTVPSSSVWLATLVSGSGALGAVSPALALVAVFEIAAFLDFFVVFFAVFLGEVVALACNTDLRGLVDFRTAFAFLSVNPIFFGLAVRLARWARKSAKRTLEGLRNEPCLGLQEKYDTPLRWPSFLPGEWGTRE